MELIEVTVEFVAVDSATDKATEVVSSLSIRAEAQQSAMVIATSSKVKTTQLSSSKAERELTNFATSAKLKAKKAQPKHQFHRQLRCLRNLLRFKKRDFQVNPSQNTMAVDFVVAKHNPRSATGAKTNFAKEQM